MFINLAFGQVGGKLRQRLVPLIRTAAPPDVRKVVNEFHLKSPSTRVDKCATRDDNSFHKTNIVTQILLSRNAVN